MISNQAQSWAKDRLSRWKRGKKKARNTLVDQNSGFLCEDLRQRVLIFKSTQGS